MKKIILSLMAGMVLFTSCDLLNNDPYDSFTKEDFFSNEVNVEMYCNYFYNEWKGYGNNGTYGVFYFPTLNDNQGVPGITPWDFKNVSATDATWNASYEEVRRANILLEHIDEADLTDASRAYYISLGRLYRGWQHFCVVRKFGDCYWVNKELTVDDATILYGKRHDRNIVMDSILADINYAVANMGDMYADSRTAYNVHVANAIKAQVCLFEGTYAKYHLKDTERANKYLTEAKTASEALIKNEMFALTPGAEGYRANYNSLDLAGNTEMIMYKQYLESAKLRHATQDYCCGSTPTNGMTKAAFNSYLMADGKLPDGNDKGKLFVDIWNDTVKSKVDPEKDSIIIINHDTIMMIDELLAARDPRLAQQVDADLRFTGCGRVRYRGLPNQKGASPNTSTTGYGILKFDEPATSASLRQSTTGNVTDCPIFWLAEVILNHAEACAELGEDAAATASINLLRARAGMPNLVLQADPANNMGVSDLIWEVRRERRVELMFDNNDRYWSLIRWRQLDKLDTKVHQEQTKGAWIDDDCPMGEGLKRDAQGYIDLNDTYVRTFEEKHYLAPIPSGQIVLNPEIGQNPGW